MRIPTPRTGRLPDPPARPATPATRSPNGRSCRWSSSAKRVLDPHDAVGAVRQPLHADHIEAHRMRAPLRLAPHQKPGGANDLVLLAPVHGGQRAAEIEASPLPHFDDGQYIPVEAHQVEFAGPASQVLGDDHEASSLQIGGRELLGCSTTLASGIGVHPYQTARMRHGRQPGYLPGSWQYGAMPTKSHHTAGGFRNNYIDSVTKSLGDVLRWQWGGRVRYFPPR